MVKVRVYTKTGWAASQRLPKTSSSPFIEWKIQDKTGFKAFIGINVTGIIQRLLFSSSFPPENDNNRLI
jgi:hypothetical protein